MGLIRDLWIDPPQTREAFSLLRVLDADGFAVENRAEISTRTIELTLSVAMF
jgi:hypothetical protein